MKKIIRLCLISSLASFAGASIFEDNSGLDEFNLGNWSSPQGVSGDNIDRTGDVTDSWLGSNGMHFLKENYTGRNAGSTAAPGFVGIYRTSQGNALSMNYTFTASQEMIEQKWIAKGTIFRSDNPHSGRLTFSVGVNGGSLVQVDQTGWFGRIADGADYEMLPGDSGYGFDGPEIMYTTDLSSLGIQPGDSVVYNFSQLENQGVGSTSGHQTGIGVQLVPEPGTFMLFGLGGLLLYLKRRKH